jgi:uncharacterized protein YndB with AHSA1/START domain
VTAVSKGDARAVADLSAGLILASVEIAATPERVFAAISTAEVAEWWGSAATYRVTRWTADLRSGGSWRCEGVSANGESFTVSGDIVSVEPPRLLVQTWKYGDQTTPATTLRYRIDPIPGGSRVTIRHEGFTDAASCESHAMGWERVLGWLTQWILGLRNNRQ